MRFVSFFTIPAIGLAVTPLRSAAQSVASGQDEITPSVETFARAETQSIMKKGAARRKIGEFDHFRELTPLDQQHIVRMNRDTLYSYAIVDLEACPAVVTRAESNGRYQSLHFLNEDHYTLKVLHEPGDHTLKLEDLGKADGSAAGPNKYGIILVRTFVDPNVPGDIKKAHELQDQLKITQDCQANPLNVPNWDKEVLGRIRNTLKDLSEFSSDTMAMLGDKEHSDPLHHALGAAAGWGGLPRSEAVYQGYRMKGSKDKKIKGTWVIEVPAKVPVDTFWSLTVYDDKGFIKPAKKGTGEYSINSYAAVRKEDGTATIVFSPDCGARPQSEKKEEPNCLRTFTGWSYLVRMYTPHEEVIDGTWQFPTAHLRA